MKKNCFYQKTKLINLYNKLEKILSDKASTDLALADLENRPTRTNIFVPIEVHNEIILDICFIEDNYLCFDTEKCKHCKKINNRRFKYIYINGIKIRLSIWIENEMLSLIEF
jgi:hypothetical protein